MTTGDRRAAQRRQREARVGKAGGGAASEPLATRHRIVRSALAKGSTHVVFVVALLILLMLGMAFLPPVMGKYAAYLVFGSGLALWIAFITYMSLPGWVDIGKDGLLIDWRSKKRFVRFADLTGFSIYRRLSAG